LIQLTFIAVVSYGIRTIIQFGYGHYIDIFKNNLVRILLFDIGIPIFEIPSIVFLYIIHFKNFSTTLMENRFTAQRSTYGALTDLSLTERTLDFEDEDLNVSYIDLLQRDKF
jgi:hypothetical protein